MKLNVSNILLSWRFLRRVIAGCAAALVLSTLQAQVTNADRVATGKSLAMERSKGNCLACHRIDDGKLPGTIGAPLVAMRLLPGSRR